ncbi:MAG: heavy metal translocating P-type ATPase [Patescibacteria group bacterium]|nr:heavy metal translocating P-type ATPase [Patescibacteria group bacterium]
MIQKLNLKIKGMHCASCAVNIENKLKNQKGINKINVNLISEKAYIEFDSKSINLDLIKKIINKLGYDTEEILEGLQNSKDIILENKLKKHLFLNIFWGIILVYLAMGDMFNWPIFNFIKSYNIFLQFILTSLIILFSFNIWKSGFKRLINLNPNMDSLIFIGTFTAYFYSLVNLFLSYFLNFKNYHFYFETAGLILIFISLGKYLEQKTKNKTSENIQKLIGLQSKEATVLRNNKEIKIPISDVLVGDIVVVRPGEKIPVDGIILEGQSAIDEKMISGESFPVDKKEKDIVIGGTINKSGFLKIKTTKVGKDTFLSQIIQMIEESLSSKPQIQMLVDKISFYFVPIVIIIAFISLIVWIILGKPLYFALTIFVSVLVIACPCALGLATPITIVMGNGLAASNGILIKNNKVLDLIDKINIFVFDKTGTLTYGEPEIIDVLSFQNDFNKNEILQIAASLEKKSNHPIAQAIVKKANNENIKILNVYNFKNLEGFGVKGILKQYKNFKNVDICLGKEDLIKKNNIDIPNDILLEIEKLKNQNKTIVILSFRDKVIGLISLADKLKACAKETVDLLHKINKKVFILTGDNKKIAESVAAQIGADNFFAEVLPQEKALQIKKIQEQNNFVAMIGDGINDSPALSQADLGIALGSGTDIAIEVGDIILVKNNLKDIAYSIYLSKYIMKKIRQNLCWAFLYNILGIPLAVGLFYPLTGWLLNPIFAGIAMVFSSISVVLNTLLMRNFEIKI